MATIQIPAGQINLKGPQAATGVDRWIQDTAPLTLTGLALTMAFVVTLPAGALALTGQAMVNPLMHPVGVLAYQGLAPTVVTTSDNTTIALPAGAVSYQGLTQTVRVGDLTVDIPAGQLVFKGPARPEVIPQIQAGSLSYQGRVMNVAVDAPGSAITIPAGQLAYTGQTPERIAGFAISLPAGSLSLSGQYVSIAFSPLQAGSLVWRGLAPSVVTQTVLIQIPAGSVAWASTALVNQLATSIGLPAGQLTLTGTSSGIVQTGLIAIPAGQLNWTGPLYSLVSLVPIDIPAGALTFSSTGLVIASIPELQIGAVTFTGTQVTPIVVGVPVTNPDVFTSTVRIMRLLTTHADIHRLFSDEVER